MTNRQWARFRIVFFVGLFFFLSVAVRHANAETKWKDETYVAVWCYDSTVLEAVIAFTSAGDVESANNLFAAAVRKDICVRIPMNAAAFRPEEITKQYDDFGGEPVVIVRGNMIKPNNELGREAYIVVPNSLLSQFKKKESSNYIVPEPSGPEYSGWQTI